MTLPAQPSTDSRLPSNPSVPSDSSVSPLRDSQKQSFSPVRSIAHPNIALIKYWGKRDDEYVLPYTGSLSLTLEAFSTTTTVQLDPKLTEDQFSLNGASVTGTPLDRVRSFMTLIRDMSTADSVSGTSSCYAHISSHNTVPTGAGLASSASGFAALATAAAHAYGLETDTTTLSRIARRGSGSACRSICANIAIWHPGEGMGAEGDLSSYAEELEGPDMAMVIVVIADKEKAVSSRVAMKSSIESSPFYPGWVSSTAEDLESMKKALKERDFRTIGEITESNALRMHAVINGNRPPVRYLAPQSIEVFDYLDKLRAEGLEVYGTADAGPNVAVLCRREDCEKTAQALSERFPGLSCIPSFAGSRARIISEDS